MAKWYEKLGDSLKTWGEDIANAGTGGLYGGIKGAINGKGFGEGWKEGARVYKPSEWGADLANLLTGGQFADEIYDFRDKNIDPFYNSLSKNNIEETMFGKSSNDIVSQYKDALDNEQQRANDVWKLEREALADATKRGDGSDRTISSSLDDYDKTLAGLNAKAEEQMNPQSRYGEFMNPYAQQQIDQSNQAIQGASGAKLQSLATQNKIMDNTANMQGQYFNTANQQALNNASQNLSGINAMAGNAGNILTADATPQQDLINFNNDWATTNLNTNVQMANNIAGTQSLDNGAIGNAFNAVKLYNSVRK